jgi:hypothetical protein
LETEPPRRHVFSKGLAFLNCTSVLSSPAFLSVVKWHPAAANDLLHQTSSSFLTSYFCAAGDDKCHPKKVGKQRSQAQRFFPSFLLNPNRLHQGFAIVRHHT